MSRRTIAIACAGEGFGHAARAVALAPFLEKEHDLIFFVPDTIAGFIRGHVPNARIISIPLFSFVKKNHSIDYLSTTTQTVRQFIENIPVFTRLTKMLKTSGIDALISDFEPITSHAASRAGIPVINLNHPGVVLKYFDLSVDAVLAKTVASLMMPPANEHLVCSFYDGDVGPILRKDLREAEPVREDHYLVYTKADSRSAVHQVLKKYPELDFRCFPDPERSYDEALISCRGVIAPAGHQALSEALCLKKPILAFPQIGQFEQRLNSIMLEKSGWGLAGDIRRIEHSIDRFLSTIDSFPREQQSGVKFILSEDTLHTVERLLQFVEASCGSRRFYLPKIRRIPA